MEEDSGMGFNLGCSNVACDFSSIHIYKSQIFKGPDDHQANWMLEVDKFGKIAEVRWEKGRGPNHGNRKRDDLDIIWHGWCEGCHHSTEYRVLFHKGASYVSSVDRGYMDISSW